MTKQEGKRKEENKDYFVLLVSTKGESLSLQTLVQRNETGAKTPVSGFCSVKLEQEVGFCHGPREDLTHIRVERGRGGIFVLGERNLGDMLSGGAGRQ